MFPTISRRQFLVSAAVLLAPPVAWPADDPVPTLLDHILLGCNDLDRGIAFIKEHTGVAAAPSGVHPGRGTCNALLSFGNRHYLEIIAPDPAQNVTSPLVSKLKSLNEPRLVGWAAHPPSLTELAKHLAAKGVVFSGPTDGSRQRPDGKLLRWQTLNLKDDKDGLLPFFIQWGEGSVHPSEDAPRGCKLEHFEAVGPDPARLARVFGDLQLEVAVQQSRRLQLKASIAGNGPSVELTS
jgi:hypothetical protein